MHTYGMDNPDFVYAASADYDIDCNWKVRSAELHPDALKASREQMAASICQMERYLEDSGNLGVT